jgi:hypothetical protein
MRTEASAVSRRRNDLLGGIPQNRDIQRLSIDYLRVHCVNRKLL